jgi:hypothetical protein
MFEIFCAEIGEDLLDLLMQYAQKSISIPIYGPTDNIASWSNFTAEDIKGEYIVDVNIGSTTPKNSTQQQQTYAWLLQTLAPFAGQQDPQTGGPMINVKALIKKILSTFPEIKNVEEILASPPPPAPVTPPDPNAGGGVEPLAQIPGGIGAPNEPTL